MSTLTRIGGGPRVAPPPTKTEYVEFRPPRRPEEYVGQAGPHNGLALNFDTLEAIAQAKQTGKPHPYVVRGELRRSDGVRFLDIAVDRAWVVENSDYILLDGFLRWQCPGCGKLSGQHVRGCDYR